MMHLRLNEIFQYNNSIIKIVYWNGHCKDCIFNKQFYCDKGDNILNIERCDIDKERSRIIKFIKL